MQFHSFPDAWSVAKRLGLDRMLGSREQMFEISRVEALRQGDSLAWHHLQAEERWLAQGQPYYRLWPSILPMLLSFELDVPCSSIVLPPMPSGQPFEALALELPAERSANPLTFEGGEVRSILFAQAGVNRIAGQDTRERGLVMVAETGEFNEHGLPVHAIRAFPLLPDATIEQSLARQPEHPSWHKGMQIPLSVFDQLARICCCVCLIGNDPDLVTVDVLAKDRAAYEAADEARRKVIEARAMRRGKFGFDLGARMEVIPHVRRPHLARVRFGKGWSMIKQVLRKGSIVHRGKMTEIPTGYTEESDAHPS